MSWQVGTAVTSAPLRRTHHCGTGSDQPKAATLHPSRIPNEDGIASTQAALGLKRNALEVVFQLLSPAATSY